MAIYNDLDIEDEIPKIGEVITIFEKLIPFEDKSDFLEVTTDLYDLHLIIRDARLLLGKLRNL